MKKLLIAIGAFACVSTCWAGTQVIGHVKAIQINKTFGSFVFVQLDAPQSAPVACQTNLGWTYTLPQQTEADKKMLALLLMAKAMGQTVVLYGSGQCSEFGAIESASAIEIDS